MGVLENAQKFFRWNEQDTKKPYSIWLRKGTTKYFSASGSHDRPVDDSARIGMF